MKRMTRLVAIIMSMLMVFAMTACSESAPEQKTDVTPTDTVTEAPKSEEVQPEEPTEAPEETPTEIPAEAENEPQEEVPTDVYKYSEYYELYAKNDAVPPMVNICTDDSADIVTVSSIEELLDAIAPHTTIIVKPGEYSISDFASTFEDYEAFQEWNWSHSYVRFDEVFDGLELRIVGANGLRIVGGSDNREDTKIVTDPRYAALFAFEDCMDIIVKNMTIGHTETGDCTGNVIDLFGTSNVIVDNMDIYGCGVFGIGTYRNSGDIVVKDSCVHDCSYGTFSCEGLWGSLICTGCEFYGSDSFGFTPDYTQDYEAVLYGCTLGPGESVSQFNKFFTDVDCEWSEPAYYPEYGY